jgi:hypothetical protein
MGEGVFNGIEAVSSSVQRQSQADTGILLVVRAHPMEGQTVDRPVLGESAGGLMGSRKRRNYAHQSQ